MPLLTVHDVAAAKCALPDADAVVVVAVYNAYDDVVRCYESFFRHTPDDVPLLIVDDAGVDRRVVEVLDNLPAVHADRVVVVLRQPQNKGFVAGMNDAFEACSRSDVVLLNSDVVVGPEWFDRMRAAALSSNSVATSSALTNHGTILSVPERNTSFGTMPGDLSVDEAACRVASSAAGTRPRLPTAVAHCTYVRRQALDLVGGFDMAFSPGYSEEVDFSQRLVSAGMQHVCADDVFVFHRGGSTFGRSPQVTALQESHERLIKHRYPYYHPWVEEVSTDDTSPLAAAVLTARVALLGLRLAVDGMCLGPHAMGTQVVVIETVRRLAELPRVTDLVVYVPETCPAAVRDRLLASPNVRLINMSNWRVSDRRHHDVVYRPYQVNFPHELAWLRSVAERVVVNQLDLISFHNGSYFSNADTWSMYRNLAGVVARTVDGLAFISEHARDEAVHAGVLRRGALSRVVYCGTEHLRDRGIAGVVPHLAAHLAPGFMLFLGTSYMHKNRPFALRLLGELHRRGWNGTLVLAGPTPPSGSSLAEEAEIRLKEPELGDHLVELGAVSEAEKAWLYERCGLVLYPTVAEGFGLVPFEAAYYGVPCLTTRQGSLDEVLPRDLQCLTDWELSSAADLSLTLLTDDQAAAEVVGLLRKHADEFTWTKVADQLDKLFRESLSRPAGSLETPAPLRGGRRGLPTVSKAFSQAVTQVSSRPKLKQRLSPTGSRREKFSRAVIRRVGSRL